MQVIAKEGITCSKDGLEAIIFTADGDMRQALNNLQVCVCVLMTVGTAEMWGSKAVMLPACLAVVKLTAMHKTASSRAGTCRSHEISPQRVM